MSAQPLQGVRVVDASALPAGRLLACVLADHGAEVVRSRALADAAWTDRGKTLVDPTDLSSLAERADVWIGEELPSFSHPGLLRVALPSFPSDHPLAGLRADGSVVAAACGVHEVPLGRRPAYAELALIDTLAMAYALNGVLGALLARERDGLGQDVVVPLHDVAYPLLELNALFTVRPPPSWPTLAWASTPFIGAWRGADGVWLYLHVGLRAHLARFLAAIADHPLAQPLHKHLSDATLRDPAQISSVREALRLRRDLRALFASQPAAAWVADLQAAGLCAVLVGDTQSWSKHPHALQSGQVIGDAPGPVPTLSASPAHRSSARSSSLTAIRRRWTERPTPAMSPTRQPPLLGLRVLDLAQVIAGPAAGRTLAELGAEVLHIRNPAFDAGWVPAFHVAFDAGKQERTLDLSTAAGRDALWELIRAWKPDVVLHNYRPGAAERMGLSEQALRAVLPEVVLAHLTAYGDGGPLSALPGWEQTAQALTGIQTAWGGATPDLYPLPCNDLGTGLFGAAAVQLALLHRRRGGGGQRVGAALSLTATWLQAPALTGQVDPATVSRLGRHALHRFYRASDGWLFLSAPSVRAARGVPGLELLADSADIATQLEPLLRAQPLRYWLSAARTAADVVIVPRVSTSAFLKDPTAVTRGLIHRRGHRGLGGVTETGCPLVLSRTPTVALTPAVARDAAATPGVTTTLRWVRGQVKGAAVMSLVPWLR